jgi:hypothetical protein
MEFNFNLIFLLFNLGHSILDSFTVGKYGQQIFGKSRITYHLGNYLKPFHDTVLFRPNVQVTVTLDFF